MLIHKNFTGGNIRVVKQTQTDVWLENELRDTAVDWFYWAFCVENAGERTVTFHFQKDRLGWFGPAVSHDLKTWKWLGESGDNEFSYTFQAGENKVYFAHHFLYHPERFFAFANAKGVQVETLCKSKKGRDVPCLRLGAGERKIVLTARHHACESTGSYVLEGVLDALIDAPLDNAEIFCVPFVDFDGVVDGDQGKSRAPHDQNRDYPIGESSLYPEVQKIRQYADEHGCTYGFDFHSPWHRGGNNDNAFIVKKSFEKDARLTAFGRLLQKNVTNQSFAYRHENDFPYMVGWNQAAPSFAPYMMSLAKNELAFTLETAYFGTPQNAVSQENIKKLGRCFAHALIEYVQTCEGRL